MVMSSLDWVGFIGVFQILLAYILNISAILDKGNPLFILLNLSGASMACLASVWMDYIPFVILEGVWAFVSLIALINYFNGRRNKTGTFDKRYEPPAE